MKVKRKDLDALFVALEMPMAAKWSEKRLLDKISKLPDVVDEETDAGDSQDLLDSVLEAVEEGTEITIVSAKASKAAPKKTKAAAKKKKPPAEEEPEEEYEEYEEEEEEPPKKKTKAAAKKKTAAKKKKKAPEPPKGANKKKKPAPKPKTPKGPGVIKSIIEFLKKANSKRPLSKDALLEKLEDRFPERTPDAMRTTINIQVPNRLKKEKELDVRKNEKGFWIVD